jgi:signal transduction histidine kinase
MNEVVGYLLLLYAGILLINVALSGLLLYRSRTRTHRALFLVWVSAVGSFVVQGALGQSKEGVALGFIAAFPTSMAMAELLASITTLQITRRIYLAGAGVALLGASIAAASGASFALIAAPIALANAVPILITCIQILGTKRGELTPMGWALTASSLSYCLHVGDFPFIRDQPQLAPVGFTLALLIGFAMSITAPAVVLERATADRARMEELNALKSRFFANISHELRTPLTVILASVEQLFERAQGEAREQLEIVRRNAGRLLRHIDELLDLSKLDAGRLRLTVAPLALRAIAENVHEINRPLAEAKSIKFGFDESTVEIGDMYGDAHRIETIIVNLVGNALKYTPEGGAISMRAFEIDGGGAVEVEDNGPGIGAAELPHVFERFYQVSRSDRRKQGGAGIGLALAKELAELHGGRLTVASELGRGTTFRLWLPTGQEHFGPEVIERRQVFDPIPTFSRRADDRVSVPTASQVEVERAGVVPSPDGERARVVIAEDQDELRRFLGQVLGEHYEVILARDGKEALDLVRAKSPNLIISDVMMPEMTGTELCRILKADPQLRHIPVLLLTARVGSEATLEAYAQGADDFVAKPFHPKVLLARARAQLEIQRLASQLMSREKLAAIGTLAAGVAHEVRNPINAITNAAVVLQEDASLGGTSRSLLGVISNCAERIDGIVSALLTHARPGEDRDASPYDPRTGLDATIELLRHRTEGVQINRAYRTTRTARAPSGPINQIVLNLLDNALRSGAKTVWLSVEEQRERILIRVKDDGSGVPRDIADRIFDPFFTTRSSSGGTGLGLYLSRGIAAEHGGTLRLVRVGEGGAEFELDLPATSRQESDVSKPDQARASST